ncbi:2-oxoacid:acceptor oxidoreductase family protein, partial [Candidatus Curtissbacteria bacterium]|nr:2-oxoacid:acceptor oxidoreductase family protein [Candidatus Curtissbacteria bacterium]
MLDIKRQVIKITGESGQGINSIGEVVAKALKRSGFYTFGYREYPSLIQGGHAFHQIDFADHPLNASSSEADILLCFSRTSFHVYLPTLKPSGRAIHMLPQLELTETEKQQVQEKKIKIAYLAAGGLAQEIGGKVIMANVVMIGALWKLMGLKLEPLEEVIRSEFAEKPDVIEPNIACLKKGYECKLKNLDTLKIKFSAQPDRKHDALLTGNHLVALGAVAAGVRTYFAYPMTPSSSLLSYIADIYHETGMLVKQIDDEISVAQMAIGAMFMGTRALVATSGGGYDLMTESVSLSGMTETPFVCILGQRPGPSTGLPTWTSASDLNLAVYAGHGEFPRCVIALSDSKSAYTAIQNALSSEKKVTASKYISKEDALKIYRDRNKNDPALLELVTANILP